jgi:D-xylose transport system permease protein
VVTDAGAGGKAHAGRAPAGLARTLRERWETIHSGDVGSWPVLLGLAAIVVFFTTRNGNFFTAVNFDNLIVQMAGTAAIAIGVVFVLLIGEIDLSIGYVSGVAGVVVAELQLPGSGHQLPGPIAILLALLTGVVIGGFQGSFVALFGVPSFVVTLAGLIALQGVIIEALPQGVIVVQNNLINDVANYHFSQLGGWIIAIVLGGGYAVARVSTMVSRRRAGIPLGAWWWQLGKVLAVIAITFMVVAITNHDRGVPLAGLLMAVLFIAASYLAGRTTFGRHVYAVGGNSEAARRAGINVARIRIIVFMISGLMAAVGGIIFSARLSSVDLNAGGGTILLDAIAAAVIGGVSLFGGRGQVKGALLGAALIATIANGIDLLGYSSAARFIVTGIILLGAVTLDTLSRRRLAESGR